MDVLDDHFDGGLFQKIIDQVVVVHVNDGSNDGIQLGVFDDHLTVVKAATRDGYFELVVVSMKPHTRVIFG